MVHGLCPAAPPDVAHQDEQLPDAEDDDDGGGSDELRAGEAVPGGERAAAVQGFGS